MLSIQPDFEKYSDGLLPVIVQDNNTDKVLMLGFMNAAAFQKTTESGRVTFYSRSKQRLWTKGESSGNFLNVVDLLTDCDNDTLLIKAIPEGPVCHTGADTCFNEQNKATDFFKRLESVINERRNSTDESSYINRLFKKGINKIAQKVGEEAVELVIEAKDDNIHLFKEEAADLLFHYLLLLNAKNTSLDEIRLVLENRHEKK